MSRIDSLLNLSPLYTLVSRDVISFSEISAVNSRLIVGCNAYPGGHSNMKKVGVLVVSLRGVNFRFWSR